jgi:phosphodiesterase/alkaline phosphatase D-like protein
VWIGPEFYANRLQDWQLREGRLEAVEGRNAKPMRTVHLLTHVLDEGPGTVSLRVRTGPIEDGPAHEDTWSGFLLGVGGAHVDFRISALSHHWPSTDGGLIVAIDGMGRIVVRDNAVHQGYAGPAPDIPIDAWPLLTPSSVESSDGPAPGARGLLVTATPQGDAYRLTVEQYDDTGSLLERAVFDSIPASHLDGNVALVSHRSPSGEGPGYWFDDIELSGTKLRSYPQRVFGPIMGAFHTLSRGVLTMTAQLGPLGDADPRAVSLEVRRDGDWREVATAEVQPLSHTAHFRVTDWASDQPVAYRVVYHMRTGPGSTERHEYVGTIRRPPTEKNELVVAALNCHHISGGDGQWNHDHFWFPHNETVRSIAHHDPDMLFFAGDQIYEGGLAGVVREPLEEAVLDYLYHWYRFVWAFGDLARDVPTVMIPDDHDVYHGNVWGNAGVREAGEHAIQDAGGYRMDPAWVNAVHRTQVGNLPPPFDPTPIANDISVYYTQIEYAGLSLAVIADRMFKSPPSVVVPRGRVVNGWAQDPAFDARREADVSGAVLLGERQLAFLDAWVDDWSDGAWTKVLLSQTLFSNVATIPDSAMSGAVLPRIPVAGSEEYIEGDKLAADMDSNGWPQTGRNRALRTIRRGFVFHIAGDQHLGSFVQYGIDDWNDAGNAFVVPSIANIWPRRWFPPMSGANRAEGAPAYTGEFLDGFGNKMTVHAVANPRVSGATPAALYDRSPGYGIVRFRRDDRTITSEAWPRWVDPAAEGAGQFPGWPITISLADNYGRDPVAWLPTIEVEGVDDPVVQVGDASGETLYTLRIRGHAFRPWVFDATGRFTVGIGEQSTNAWQLLTNLEPTTEADSVIRVTFDSNDE